MLYVIITEKTRWAIFDEENKESVVSYFKKCNNPEEFIVVSFLDEVEVSRCNLLEFK